jgi:hypothetical protein
VLHYASIGEISKRKLQAMTIRINRWFVLALGAVLIALMLLVSPWQKNVSAEDSTPVPEPRVTGASMERFEHGYMVWIQDTKKIYVLYDGPALFAGTVEVFDDTWVQGMADTDTTLKVPSDKMQPYRGFGWIWKNNAQVKAGLGWAVEPSTGYTVLFEERGDKIWLNGQGWDVFTIVGNEWKSVDVWRK